MSEATQAGFAGTEQADVALRLACITIWVRDYDEALRFYTEKLGFEKKMDETFGPGARWLTVSPKGQDMQIVLQKPEPAMHGEARAKEMSERVGKNPTGVLATDDFQKAYETLLARGVKFSSPPKEMQWGKQAVLEDLYGNAYALVERPKSKG
jgi:catechol 2,3-dioxygenase-like lactoylglutathione lyase family enzyme